MNISSRMLISLLILFAPALPLKGAATVSFLQGDVTRFDHSSGKWVKVKEGFELSELDVIDIPENSICELDLEGRGLVTLFENSRIEIRELELENRTRVDIRLDFGMINSLLEPLKEEESTFVIESPVAAVGVRGTEFDLAYEDESQAEVNVYRGEVEVERLDENGNPVERSLVPSNQAAQIIRNAFIKRKEQLNQNRKIIRDLMRTWVQSGKARWALARLNREIRKKQRRARFTFGKKNRDKIEQELELMYRQREDMRGRLNFLETELENRKAAIRKFRATRAVKLANFKKKFREKLQEKLRKLSPKQKRTLKRRLRERFKHPRRR